MATRLIGNVSLSDGDNVFKKVKRQIEEIFDSLIEKVNERREVLLRQLNQWEEEFNRTRSSCIQSLEEIKRERADMELCLSRLKIIQARTSMEKGIVDLDNVISQKENKLNYPKFRFIFDKNDFDLKISKFGSLTKETDNVLVRNYTQLSKPVKVFGTFGKGKGEFSNPRGVAIDIDNQMIFIADYCNSLIQVWSLEGIYLSEFGKGKLATLWEIVLSDNFIFISDIVGSSISKWCLNTFNLVNKSNTSQGSEPGQLDYPSGLDVDNAEVFVVEYNNNRISVFDLNLKFKRIMANKAIDRSRSLRVRNDIIYIVEQTGTIKLFSKADQLLKTIPKLSVFSNNICHFTLDSQLNFLMSDRDTNSLFVVSPEGDLIHSHSFAEFNLKQPYGIDISRDGTIVVCFANGSNAIATF